MFTIFSFYEKFANFLDVLEIMGIFGGWSISPGIFLYLYCNSGRIQFWHLQPWFVHYEKLVTFMDSSLSLHEFDTPPVGSNH